MANAIEKWKDAGYEVQREFKGSEGFPNAFLIGPTDCGSNFRKTPR